MTPAALLFLATVSLAQEAPPGDACAADAALLAALQVFLSEATGEDGAERLGRLVDPRAVSPLEHGARTRALPIALAATRNLAGHGSDGVRVLAGLLGDGTARLEVREVAAQALGLASRPDAGEALVAALDTDLPRPVRVEVVEALRRWYPDRSEGLQRIAARDGTGWLVPGAALGLGYALGSAGHFGKANLVGIGIVTGGVAGVTLGLVGGRLSPVEADDAAFWTTSGAAGTFGGVMAASGLMGDGTGDAGWLGGLVGGAAGYGLGWAFMDEHRGTVGDTWEAVGVTAASTLGAFTTRIFIDPYDGDHYGTFAGFGMLGGMVAGHLAAPHVDLTRNDAGWMALTTTWGTVAGSLVPVGDRSRESLPFVGLAGGYLAGYALADAVEIPGDVTTGAFAGLAFGSFAGWGAGALLPDPDGRTTWVERQTVSAIALAGGTAGAVAGGWLARRDPAGVRADDVVLSSLTSAWTLWQSTGWWIVAERPSATFGLVPLVPSVAGAAVAVASPALDVDVERTLPALSLGLWGVYVGAATAVLADAEEPLAWSLTGSDLGLGLGVLLMSPLVDAPPLVVATADAGGALGVGVGLLGATFVTEDTDHLLTASLVGAGVGAVGGAVLGGILERRSSPRGPSAAALPRLPRVPGTWTVLPATLTDGEQVAWGAGLTVSDW